MGLENCLNSSAESAVIHSVSSSPQNFEDTVNYTLSGKSSAKQKSKYAAFNLNQQ